MGIINWFEYLNEFRLLQNGAVQLDFLIRRSLMFIQCLCFSSLADHIGRVIQLPAWWVKAWHLGSELGKTVCYLLHWLIYSIFVHMVSQVFGLSHCRDKSKSRPPNILPKFGRASHLTSWDRWRRFDCFLNRITFDIKYIPEK